MPTVNRRERVLIGLALGAVIIVALYLYVVEPLLDRYRELAELMPARAATLEARRRLIAQRPRLIEELAEATTLFDQQTQRLLPGPTAPLAASDLQRVVKEVTTSANVDVRSERVLPPNEVAGLQEVPIELTVAGSLRDTVALLAQIERTSRLPHRQGRQGARGCRGAAPRALDHANGGGLPPAHTGDQLVPYHNHAGSARDDGVALDASAAPRPQRGPGAREPRLRCRHRAHGWWSSIRCPARPRRDPWRRPAPPAVPSAADPGPDTYAVIAAQNLFNPARSETATATAVAVVKPILHGVGDSGRDEPRVSRGSDGQARERLLLGDAIGGGKIQKIADDRVMIVRPEGMVEVLLQDPSKPRPAPTAGPGVIAGQGQPVPGQPAAPGQIAPGQFVPGQPAPGQFAPVQVVPGQPALGQTVPGLTVPAQGPRPNTEALTGAPGPPAQSRRRPQQGQRGNE
jgi:hypothetical protein